MPELFYAHVSGLHCDMETAGLSEYRREKLRRIRHEAEYRRSLGAGLLLVRAVERLRPDIKMPPDIVIEELGKPALRGGQLCFSLSHSGETVACAVSGSAVGTDIQQPGKYNEALAERFFTVEECEDLLTAEDRNEAFTKLWCLKESYLKWLGTGLTRPLSSFSVAVYGDEAVIPADDRCRLWQGRLNGCQYAVCAFAEDSEFNITRIELP